MAVSALVWLGGVGVADATLVRGRIDPQFGSNAGGIASNLGWSADLQFDVAQSCIDQAAGQYNCAITNLSATGTLYDTTPSNLLDGSVDYLQHASPIPSTFLLTVDGSGHVTGIDTGPIGYYSASTSLFTGNIWVEFSRVFDEETEGYFTDAELIAALCKPLSEPTFFTPTLFDHEGDDCGGGGGSSGGCIASTNPGDGTGSAAGLVTITQVPEPGSLWLVIGAVAAGGLLLRRRVTL